MLDGTKFSVKCGCFKGKVCQQNTAYVEDFNNYIVLCPECYIEVQEYWASMWNEYYGRLL
jgi:hypothetical protein